MNNILEKVKKAAQKLVCRHKYNLRALADTEVICKCQNCGKEIIVNGENVPDMLLRWGYGWYHGDISEEKMELLKRQEIKENNIVIIPEQIVYVVSYFEKMEERTNRNGTSNGIDLGDICTEGVYFTQNQLRDALKGPIAACFYPDYSYACVECYESGLANPKQPIRFFKYDTQTCAYLEIEPSIRVRRQLKTIAMGLN